MSSPLPHDEADLAATVIHHAEILHEGVDIVQRSVMEQNWEAVDTALTSMITLAFTFKVAIGVLVEVQSMRRPTGT